MPTVRILELQPDGTDKEIGRIQWNGKRFSVDGLVAEGILHRPVYPLSGGSLTMADGERFLNGLQYQYKSAYLRATAPEVDRDVQEAPLGPVPINPPHPLFTGMDRHGHKWVNGRQVRRNDPEDKKEMSQYKGVRLSIEKEPRKKDRRLPGETSPPVPKDELLTPTDVENKERVENAIKSIRARLGPLRTAIRTSSSLVTPQEEYIAYRTLVALPPALQKSMQEMGVSIDLVHGDDEEHERFSVAGNSFCKGGDADYTTGKVRTWVTKGPKDQSTGYYEHQQLPAIQVVLGHELGHFALQSLLLNAAKLKDDAAYAEESGEPNSASTERLKVLSEAIREFDEATLKEGGVTPYVQNYVKAHKQSQQPHTDAWKYSGPYRSTTYQRDAGKVAIDDDDPVPIIPTASISRAANENYAEITSRMIGARHYKEAEARLDQWRSSYPETYQAFQKLWDIGKSIQNTPKGAIA